MISDEVVDLHYELIDSHLALVPELPPQVDAESLVATMKADNKRTGDSLRFVLLDALGSCALEEGDPLVSVDEDSTVDLVARFLAAYPARLEYPERRSGWVAQFAGQDGSARECLR